MKTAAIVGSIVGAFLLAGVWGCGSGGGNPAAPGGQTIETPDPLQWVATQRLPASELLLAVDGFGDTHLAVGAGGVVLSRKGAGSWEVQRRNVGENLNDVVMIDQKKAIAVGNEGILRTVDAGATWKQVLSSDDFLRDVSILGNTAVAVGNNAIFYSGDAGESWKAATSFPSLFYSLVSVQSATTITAIGTGPAQLRSTDGGETWTQVAVAELPLTPIELEFFTEDAGTAILSPARVFFTSDGGDTWDEIASFGVNRVRHLDRIDKDTGYAVLESGHVHVTGNSGKSWSFDTIVQLGDGEIEAIDASDDNAWCAVGPLGFITESPDGGASWNEVSSGRVGDFLSVAFSDQNNGVAAFDGRIDPLEKALRTVDGGATWFPVDSDIKRPEFVVMSGTIGLFVGGGDVSLSTNSGAIWNDVSPAPGAGLHGAAIVDNDTYVICGENNTVLRTTNGAVSWETVTVPTPGSTIHQRVAFFPGTDVGVMIGENSGLRTTDRGEVWSGVNARGQAVACASADVAIAVGDEILRTGDRGVTWNLITLPEHPLNAVAFTGSLHGVAVGQSGVMLETLDGGLTWNAVDRETTLNLSAVAFRGTGLAVSAGRNGVVLAGSSP